jgi:dipeptidyl aminopeptidase/acylaminoacyl peptidase
VQSATGAATGPLPVDAFLTTTRIMDIAYSNDGRKFAYSSNASGRLNLWIMNTDGTGVRQLAKSDENQLNAVFTRDNSAVLYGQDRGGNEYFDIYAVPVDGGVPRNLTNTPDVSETVDEFSPDGRLLAFDIKQKTSPSVNLAVMEWPSGTVRELTHEMNPKASWSENAWSPDGKFIYATRSIGIDDSEIYRVDAVTGASEELLKHADKVNVRISALSRDGSTLLLTSNAKDGYDNVALFDLATRKLRWLTNTQWAAFGVTFTPDDKGIVYLKNADGRVSIRFLDLKTMRESERGVPEGLNYVLGVYPRFLPDGSILISHEDSSKTQEVYRLGTDDRFTQISHFANETLAHAVLPRSQLVTYRSFDGMLISAFVWVPLNLKRDGTAAAVVMPHGGPSGQVVDSFNGRAELLASRGFVVILPNVRGSTGYGMQFQNANIKDLGGGDLKDEIAGVDFLKATGFIDPKRVGIWGGSYGGFMTLMAIGKTPGLWSAAVDEYGILNWMTMLEHSDPLLQEYEKVLLGDPVKDRAIYENSSPLKYIRNETAPVLVLQGDNDIRVPREEAEQLVSVLKAEGRTIDSVFYPDEGHGFAKREHQEDELNRSVAWLQKYLQGAR